MRVVLVAEEAAGVQALRRLLALPHPPELVAVLTSLSSQPGRRPLVYEAARALDLPTGPAEAVRDANLAMQLRQEKVDLLLNVHSRFLVHPDVLAAPRIGSFNLHPGPLPEYAGLNVTSWAIYNGEHVHAVTVHWLDAGIDTGPVAYTAALAIEPGETGLSLAGKCAREGVPLLLGLVRQAQLAPEAIPRIEQDLRRRRYFGRQPPQSGRIDWSCPAAEIARFVRAADYGPFPSPWGRPLAELCGRTVAIAEAEPTGCHTAAPPGTLQELNATGALVATGDQLLLVRTLWLDGRKVGVSDATLAH